MNPLSNILLRHTLTPESLSKIPILIIFLSCYSGERGTIIVMKGTPSPDKDTQRYKLRQYLSGCMMCCLGRGMRGIVRYYFMISS